MKRAEPGGLFVLVTGAGRGIGLEFARQWAARGDTVFALARDPAAAALQDLARRHAGRVHPVACDVASDASVEAARRAVEAATGRLDIVVNNAGVFGREEERLDTLDLDEVRRTFEINTLGAIRVSRVFLPLLRKGSAARLVHITSGMGSVGDNRSGGHWSYRISKTGLNMVSRNLAIELQGSGVVSVVLSPGWVRTDMGGRDAPLSPEESVAAMIRTIDGLGAKQSGASLDRFGKPAVE